MTYHAYCSGKEISDFHIGGKQTSEIWGGNTLLWKKEDSYNPTVHPYFRLNYWNHWISGGTSHYSEVYGSLGIDSEDKEMFTSDMFISILSKADISSGNSLLNVDRGAALIMYFSTSTVRINALVKSDMLKKSGTDINIHAEAWYPICYEISGGFGPYTGKFLKNKNFSLPDLKLGENGYYSFNGEETGVTISTTDSFTGKTFHSYYSICGGGTGTNGYRNNNGQSYATLLANAKAWLSGES